MALTREQEKAMFALSKKKTKKQRLDLLTDRTGGNDFGRFENLPPSIAMKLLTGEPNVNPNDNQNNSPTAKELVKLAKENDGTLSGYYVGVKDASRDDHRITFDGIILKLDEKRAEQLRDTKSVDEFRKIDTDSFSFWWD